MHQFYVLMYTDYLSDLHEKFQIVSTHDTHLADIPPN